MQWVVIMNDNFDEIADLLKNGKPPEPSDMAKNLAISKAMAEFEKKNSPTHQGITPVDRLIDTVKAVFNNLIGEFTMKKAYITAGGVCACLVAVSIMYDPYLSGQYTKSLITPEVVTTGVIEKEQISSHLLPKPKADGSSTKSDMLLASPPRATLQAPPPPIEAPVYTPPPIVAPPPITLGAIYNNAPASIAVMDRTQPYSYHNEGRDKFEQIKQNSIKLVKEEPVSTFSVDVDTSSYSFMRASLNNNVLPQKDAVRVEEMINYFSYDYEVPKDKSEPFKANVAVFATPWNPDTKLLHIGIKGYQLEQKEKPHSNLVFLIDTSGSMSEVNKLPLLKNSLKLLLNTLQADDTVAIVTYAGNAGIALEPTKVSETSKIINILDNLGAGGSTAGAQGIKTAYDLAERHFNKNGVNRVLLATDGDFNVGITNQEELKSFIERKRDSGIFLSVLGFGMGNYNDSLMQTLAQNGNGNAAYIDNLNEARKALVDEASSTLFTIAKDVKIQVEFNPEQVSEYRLIGYETRMLNREDFNNDKVDAGDIGSGHTVTAIYEITPVGSKAKLIDDSRYQKPEIKADKQNGEYAFIKIRYKLPDSDISKLVTTPVDSKNEYKAISDIPTDSKFATSVAAFAQLLRGDSYIKSFSYDDVINLAQSAKGEDKFGYRAEFINTVRLAKNAPALTPTGQ